MTSNATTTPPVGTVSTLAGPATVDDANQGAHPVPDTDEAGADEAGAGEAGAGEAGAGEAGAGEAGADELGPDPAGLHARALEAQERLIPEHPVIPAPRSPQGVTVPPAWGHGTDQPSKEVVGALRQLVSDLEAVRRKPEEPAHQALVRIGELTSAGIPDGGWSRTEALDPDVVAEASDLASELLEVAAGLLERLDAEQLLAPAVVVDRVVTSLQVMRMVADLELFARSRG